LKRLSFRTHPGGAAVVSGPSRIAAEAGPPHAPGFAVFGGRDRLAAPHYLARRGKPAFPEDLAGHDGLLTGPAARTWNLKDSQGREVEVAPIARLIADESAVLLRAASDGLGIVCLPEAMSVASIAGGTLERVLPDWTAGSVTTTILTTHRRSQLPAVRAVIDVLAAGGLAEASRDGP